MSILTKILAVLLSVISLVLVGMVVTFVGNTNNYKEMYEAEKSLNTVLKSELTTKDELYNTQINKTGDLETKYLQQIRNLEADKDMLASDLRKAERMAQKYQADADKWKGVMTGFEQSVRNLQTSLSQTQQQLDEARSQGIKDQKELSQITADLYEKIVQLQSLEAERRRLLEQKKKLEERAVSGSVGAREIIPVTPLNRTARPAVPTAATVSSDIKGQIVQVSENLVTLSIGSADGVRENMVFHVTRGDRFLCDVLVTNVDINQCAGILDLVQDQPKVGDTVSTQL